MNSPTLRSVSWAHYDEVCIFFCRQCRLAIEYDLGQKISTLHHTVPKEWLYSSSFQFQKKTGHTIYKWTKTILNTWYLQVFGNVAF